MNSFTHGPEPSPEKMNPGRLETILPVELEAQALMRIAGMRGTASMDIEEPAGMKRDVLVPKLQKELILDTLALYAWEELGVGR